MEEKKNNNKLYSIIIILCLMVIGLSIYIIYDKVDTNESENKKEIIIEPEKQLEKLSNICLIMW